MFTLYNSCFESVLSLIHNLALKKTPRTIQLSQISYCDSSAKERIKSKSENEVEYLLNSLFEMYGVWMGRGGGGRVKCFIHSLFNGVVVTIISTERRRR